MNNTAQKNTKDEGFTLIELSIVLVIIGLIVGGVLVGQDLIKAAELRATVSQIEKYNTAVNTFRLKYNGIPGDLSSPATFFTVAGAGGNGEGDGDGVVEGVSADNTPCTTTYCHSGESVLFWYELSQAGLIAENISENDFADYAFAVGAANSVASKSGGHVGVTNASGRNYFVLANMAGLTMTNGTATFTAAITPEEAFQLDTKIDDGGPATGTVLSIVHATSLPGTAGGGSSSPSGAGSDDCYDSDATAAYAVGVASTGDVNNCNISIRAAF